MTKTWLACLCASGMALSQGAYAELCAVLRKNSIPSIGLGMDMNATA